MRLFVYRLAWVVLLLLLGGIGYHLTIFHVWPWWVVRQLPQSASSVSVVSTAAAFEAVDVLTVDVNKPGAQQWWTLLWYALRSDRPRERAVLVPHEGGPNVHSLYLLAGEAGHRITIHGLEVHSGQPAVQHLAAR